MIVHLTIPAIWPRILLVIILAVVINIVYSGYKARSHVNRLRKMGLVCLRLFKFFNSLSSFSTCVEISKI